MRNSIASIALTLAVITVLTTTRAAGPSTAPSEIAHFDFSKGIEDTSGERAVAVLKNTARNAEGLTLTGEYGDDQMNGDHNSAKFRVSALDYDHFTIAWRFKANDFASDGQVRHWNLLACGEWWRWLTFTRRPSGVVRLGVNGGDITRDLSGTNVKPNVWTTIACSFDLGKRQVLVAINGVAAPAVDLPSDFKLNVVGATKHGDDRILTLANYSNQMTFSGIISEIVVYPGAMTSEQIARLLLPNNGDPDGR